jgi:hypothetical protein
VIARIVLGLVPLILSAEDIGAQLEKWKPLRMPFHAERLSAREKQLTAKLVEAGQAMEAAYWQQTDPDGLKLLRSTNDPKLRRFLLINGSRWDLLNQNAPFGGAGPMPPGRNLYPPGVTRETIERYAAQHRQEREAIYSPFTILRGDGGRLNAIPYSKAFPDALQRGAKALREAADLTGDPAFARFLRLRAEAFLKDDYYESDLSWMDLKNPRFDVIMGPYETYLDDVLGVKTSFSSAILIRNDEESRKLELYQRYVPDIQDALPVPAVDRPSKKGHLTPMEVMDAPFRTGDLAHGYQAVADNLPNDPRIHAKKGSKKIFFKNFMDARVDNVILPLAKQLMRPDQAARVSAEGYMAGTVLHEIAHGLGPAYARTESGRLEINTAVGPVFSALEEAKADVAGMFGLQWLMEHGALSGERSAEYYASYLAGILRSVRYGVAEAHGRAEMMEFNYGAEQGAFRFENGRYSVDYARMPLVIAQLAKELLTIEASGDRKRAEAWFARYDKMPSNLAESLKRVHGVPIDIEPQFDFPLLSK